MSYQFYNWLHLVAVLLVFSSLGALSLYAAQGGTKSDWVYRRPVAILHGLGLLALLIAGFGLMARLKLNFVDHPWLYIKLSIWLILGIFPVLVWKFGRRNLAFFYLLVVLGSLAIYSVIFRIGAGPN